MRIRATLRNSAFLVTAILLLAPRAWSAGAGFGDVNADGQVDAVDVQLVINAALQISVPYPTDLNNDGQVNAVDVQLVINAALGLLPQAPSIVPSSAAPGTPVTITISGLTGQFDTTDPLNNRVFFGSTEMPVLGATATTVTTTAPIVPAGNLTVSAQVSGSDVVSGLAFTVLPGPTLTAAPGTVSAQVQNNVTAVNAAFSNLITPLMNTLGLDSTQQSAITTELGYISTEFDAVSNLNAGATDAQKQVLDQVLISSGFAQRISDLNTDLSKQMARLALLDAKFAKSGGGVPGLSTAKFPARYRFVLDWLSGRLQPALAYADAAMLALSAAATFSPGLGVPTTALGLYMSALNGILTLIEATPIQLVHGTMTGQLASGSSNIATNSFDYVVFHGTFQPKVTTAQVVDAIFMPGFSSVVNLPSIMSALLSSYVGLISGQITVYPLPSESNVPILTYDFVGDPPTTPNDYSFSINPSVSLDVGHSIIYTYDQEGGPFELTENQRVYYSSGSVFTPSNLPHTDVKVETASVPFSVKKGLKITLTSPAKSISVNQSTIDVAGTITDPSGSPVSDGVNVTITSGGPSGAPGFNQGEPVGGGSTTTTTTSGGGFGPTTVPLQSGTNTITVQVSDGVTTSTATVTVMNGALPSTYCLVTNHDDDTVSVVDPTTGTDLTDFGSGTGSPFDNPEEARFLHDGQTAIVLNNLDSNTSTPTHLCAIKLQDLNNISTISPNLDLGTGSAASMAITPDGSTVLIPTSGVNATDNALFVVDVRQPSNPRIASTVPMSSYNASGPVNVATGTDNHGRTVALVTTGDFTSNSPSDVVSVDITDPYNATVLGTTSVASSGGAIAVIPGQPLAVVSGTSVYINSASQQEIDNEVQILDFSDATNVTTRGSLPLPSVFAISLAVTPDGKTALIGDMGNPLSPSNTMVFVDLTNPDALVESATIPRTPFPGTGCARIAISSDGKTAAATSHLGNEMVLFTLNANAAPTVQTPTSTGTYPWGVTFNQ